MNMQAMLKQAQALQKDMLKSKEEVDNADFVGESSLVKITMKGTKKVTEVKILAETLDKDDLEALEDMLLVAYNQASDKVDETLEKKMGKFGNIPGLF